MKIGKKFTFIALFLSLVLMLTACTRSEMIDYSELNRRLKRENKSFAFSEENVFYGSGVYFAPYSLLSPEDMLLAMGENEKGQLTKVTLTASRGEATDEIKQMFSEFAKALTAAFVPEKYSESLLGTLEEYGKLSFTDCIKKAVSGRYTLWLCSNTLGVSMIIIRE